MVYQSMAFYKRTLIKSHSSFSLSQRWKSGPPRRAPCGAIFFSESKVAKTFSSLFTATADRLFCPLLADDVQAYPSSSLLDLSAFHRQATATTFLYALVRW